MEHTKDEHAALVPLVNQAIEVEAVIACGSYGTIMTLRDASLRYRVIAKMEVLPPSGNIQDTSLAKEAETTRDVLRHYERLDGDMDSPPYVSILAFGTAEIIIKSGLGFDKIQGFVVHVLVEAFELKMSRWEGLG